jgi:DNA polymerase III delta subunit
VNGGALAYVHGNDEYGMDQAAISIAARLTADPGAPPIRWRVTGADVDVATIAERVATGTLFGGGTLAMIVDPSPLLRSADGRAAMVAVLDSIAPGNGLVFLAPRNTPRDRPSAALDALREAVAAGGGEVIEVLSPRPDRFPGWIVDQARARGIDIEADAARELALRVGAHVREGDVDRSLMSRLAVGELDKLALFAPDRRVTSEDVRALVAESTPASMWAFLDAIAERQPARIAAALDPILEGTPEPVLVAALHRRLRDLIEVSDRLASGETVASLVRSMRIKEYPARKLAAQAARWQPDELVDTLEGLADLDALIKGEIPVSDAQRRLAFTIWIRERIVADRPRLADR